MSDQTPNIDFARIPDDLAGLWVVLRLGVNQEVVGQGDSPQEAVRQSQIDPGDTRFALTQVPRTPTAAWMRHSGQANTES